MIEVGDVSNTDGFAAGPGAQANSQHVTINMPALPPIPPEPPEPPLKEQIRSTNRAVLSLNQMFVADQDARIPIQQEAAAWRRVMLWWLIGLTVLVAGNVLANVVFLMMLARASQ